MQFENAAKYKFVLEPRYFYFGWSKTPDIVGQPALFKQLAAARKLLPPGYNFKIWDCQRPRYVQLAMIESFHRRIKSARPRWSEKKIAEETRKFAALPLLKVTRPDTHRNGGAIDLTIVDGQGAELYMGTDHDDLTEKAATDFFSKIKQPNALQREAAKNRKLLIKVLTAVGFENLPSEWWHWSYLEPAHKSR